MIKQLYRFLHPGFQNLFLEFKVDFKPRYGHGLPPHPELNALVSKGIDNYRILLNKALEYKSTFWEIESTSNLNDTINPFWNNGFFPGLDIISLYTMIAEYKPKHFIEIGSGNSTKVAHKAIIENALSTQLISIDPMPRAEIDHLSDIVIRQPFEKLDLQILGLLEENDILFVDNSHRILPNSDSMVFYMEVLPRLKKGVIVHIHDIYLPFDYPQFMCNRFYSEQYGLAMYLLANPDKFETILPNYFISENSELSAIIAPIWEHKNLQNVEKHGGSYWLKINE